VNHQKLLTALVANASGQIFELDGYNAVGMDGPVQVPLSSEATINMPHGSELMYLPDRAPILYNPKNRQIEVLEKNPDAPGEQIFPVAVFNSPGYIASCTSAYQENKNAGFLPLFSYGAVGWHNGRFRSAAIRVDTERRQDLRLMNMQKVAAGVADMERRYSENRLVRHLAHCALSYGCPAGKNFFLGRYEAPLPTATRCNARCLGCLSLQQNHQIPCSQNRIDFTPSPKEITEVALAHIRRVRRAIVSFGQGCEGDPLLAADNIESAILKIRATTRKGTINMNTNGSLPNVLKRLLDAGLDSVRVSINSFRKPCYNGYFRPQGYLYSDVLKSIGLALERGKFVSINYLNLPGFSDTPEEVTALKHFLSTFPIQMIQWRNLNFDPQRYLKRMTRCTTQSRPIGVKPLLAQIRSDFPNLKFGYFNPPKETFQQH
jgi:pyruvate-formate lyase-activating enzyme